MISIAYGLDRTGPPSINEYKGQSLYLEWVDNYVVVDIETTGYVLHHDEITELAAVKVVNGMIVSEFQSLVKTSLPISEGITRLTGITNEMLDTAPIISKILPRFLAFVWSDIVVAHNANFDINFINDACIVNNLGFALDNDFIDTMMLSRELFPTEHSHKLKYLVKRFGIANEVEHRGLSDAKNTQKCYEYMKQYAANNPKIVGSYSPHNVLKAKAKVSNNNYINETMPVYGKTFVFTGGLERMSRKNAEQLVIDMGGICGSGVTVKTNYLVLGDNDDNPLIKDKDGKSAKLKKAERYKESGRDIEIISEDVFYKMVLEDEKAG